VGSDVEAFGAAFGEYLVKEHGMMWVTVTDEFGSAKAVRHAESSTMAFPVDSVGKRYDDDSRAPFFWEISQVLKSQIEGRLE
jgi:hypothetical protein